MIDNSLIKIFFVALLATLYCSSVSAQLHLELAENTDWTFQEIIDSVDQYYEVMGKEKGKGYKPYQRWKYEAQRSVDAQGRIVSRIEQGKTFKKYLSQKNHSKSLDVTFQELGPLAQQNTSTWSSSLGRISAIGLDRNDDNHIIVGSPSGGIWQTKDKGSTWKAVYDYATNINILSLCISHSSPNKYWAGTTERIIHSNDGGETWNDVDGGPSGRVNTIIMHPTDSLVLFSAERWGGKIHRSSNGGTTWAEVFNGNYIYDIEFHPTAPDTVYASGSGYVIKSIDGGMTWNTIQTGNWNNSGVIMLAVTKNDPNYVYALQETGGGYNATFRSTNGGVSWSTQSDNSSGTNNILTYDQESNGGQAPRDMDIVVSPDDKNKVYVAGTELWYSQDGGVNFQKKADWLVDSDLPFIHADVDLMYYTDSGLYVGTDGGIFISTNEGDSFTDHTPGIGVRQFYRIGASQTMADRVSGGSQDNGTGVLVNGVWRDYLGADGMETFIDWSNADIMYGNVQNGQLWKSIDGGQNTIFVTQVGGDGAWITPTEQDPVNPNTIYHGKAEIYKSTNGAVSWDTISNLDLGRNCNEIEIAPSNNQVIYASWGDALYKTVNGGTTWSNISPNQNHINYIDVHPSNPNRVAIAQHSKIYESTNGGMTWNDITQNLPSITYNCVLYQGDATDGIYAGGKFGIWHKDQNTSNQWLNQSGNMPIAEVTELEIRNGVMYVATYGRGLWKTNIGTDEGMTCQKAVELTLPGTFTAPGPSYGSGCHNCVSSTHSNWYKFTPSLTGKVNIRSCLSGVDTRLFIYSGTCSAFNQIANSDDDCQSSFGSSNLFSSLVENLDVTAGTPIYIEWDNRWSTSSFFWSIEFMEVECLDNLSLVNSVINSQSFKTQNSITSSQTISGNNTTVDYSTGSEITLLADFKVSLGAMFRAFIDGCNNTLLPNDHVEYFGFTLVDTYWDDPTDSVTKTNYSDEVHSFSNMADILVVTPSDYIIDRIDSMVNLDMKAVLHLNEIFFEVVGTSSPSGNDYDLRSDYQQRWNDFVTNNSLHNHKSKILTFYIGEEPTWNGISYTDFSAATDFVKNQFPTIPIMLVEAYPILDSLQVPQSVDWLGFDHYFVKDPLSNTVFQQEWTTLKSKRSTAEQKLVIILDSHYISWAHGDFGNIALTEMENVAESYYQLAISEQSVIAIFGYYWPNSFEFPEAIGARGMPQNVIDKYIEIGKEISGKN